MWGKLDINYIFLFGTGQVTSRVTRLLKYFKHFLAESIQVESVRCEHNDTLHIHVGATALVEFAYLFVSYERTCSAHAGYIRKDRSLLTGHDALPLQEIARDLLHALSYRHDNT